MTELHSLRVAATLPCRRCGYDLRGLHADGRCPECGLPLIESIAARVDPEIAQLSPLPRPRTAGVSLLALTASMAVAAIAAAVAVSARASQSLPAGGWGSLAANILPAEPLDSLAPVAPLAIVAGIIAAAALLSSVGPVISGRGSRRLLLFLGLGAWLAAACLPPSTVMLTLCGAAASVALIGLGPIATELGRRSRTYRERTAARQAIGPVLTAIAVGVTAAVLALVLERHVGPDAATLVRLAAAACLGMTVVGFLYLVLNALWIWAALRAWQPMLSRIVERPDAGTSDRPNPGVPPPSGD